MHAPRRTAVPLYTAEERRRRDASPWTVVQGVLAPLQFLVMAASLGLIIRYLTTGAGVEAALASVVVKTGFLLAIMVTGAIWEREVFGRWLFAPAFFWEDVASVGVIALHLAYVAALFTRALTADALSVLALAAYAAYALNAGQFLWKLRLARRQAPERGAGRTEPGALPAGVEAAR